ncbi:hypothetical protein FTX61_17330 [Nitriliruptoraceae bacterium ZYF776]|nr:hypothetical protein [Profundirhabdus halotolerans]
MCWVSPTEHPAEAARGPADPPSDPDRTRLGTAGPRSAAAPAMPRRLGMPGRSEGRRDRGRHRPVPRRREVTAGEPSGQRPRHPLRIGRRGGQRQQLQHLGARPLRRGEGEVAAVGGPPHDRVLVAVPPALGDLAQTRCHHGPGRVVGTVAHHLGDATWRPGSIHGDGPVPARAVGRERMYGRRIDRSRACPGPGALAPLVPRMPAETETTVTSMRSQADALAAELALEGEPERAEKERAYLKSALHHLGVSVPAIRATAKRFHRDHPDLGHDEVVEVVTALWDVPVHERRMTAVELLDLYGDTLSGDDLPLLDRLLHEVGTWAILDGLAADVVGPLRERQPEATDPWLERWTTDPDRWVRRASLLAHLVALREGRGDLDAFGARADRLLADTDPFVRKAIGWVLRDTSRRRPEAVVAWLEPRVGHLARPTLREAVRQLPDPDRDRLLAATGVQVRSTASSRGQ